MELCSLTVKDMDLRVGGAWRNHVWRKNTIYLTQVDWGVPEHQLQTHNEGEPMGEEGRETGRVS